jgi:hypothetical protein
MKSVLFVIGVYTDSSQSVFLLDNLSEEEICVLRYANGYTIRSPNSTLPSEYQKIHDAITEKSYVVNYTDGTSKIIYNIDYNTGWIGRWIPYKIDPIELVDKGPYQHIFVVYNSDIL